MDYQENKGNDEEVLEKFKKLSKIKKELEEKDSSVVKEKWCRADNPFIWNPIHPDSLED